MLRLGERIVNVRGYKYLQDSCCDKTALLSPTGELG